MTPNIINIDQHLALKRYILFFFTVLASISVKAQSGFNYQEWGVGLGASYERGYTNITTQYSHPGVNFNFIYNYNPYLPVEAEFQAGTLSGGGPLPSQDPYGRQYVNNYKAFVLHADYQLGGGIDYTTSWIARVAKDLYIGTGIGFLDNDNTVQRTSIYEPSYVFPGKDKSINIMFPLRFGYEFKFYDAYDEPSIAIDIGYVHTIAFGEGMDGYNDPPSRFKNDALDQYRQITINFKYFFGNVTSYNKLIRQFY
jgi:hypothetical protein